LRALIHARLLSWLPIYEDNGRCLIHVGLGISHSDLDEDVYRLRARTLLRNGPAALHPPLANVLIGASSQTLIVPEFALQWGEFSLQAEYCANWFGDTRFPAAGGPFHGTTFQQSAYVQALYCLTRGDYTSFNTKLGSGTAFARTSPQRPYFWVEGEDGCNCHSPGAWQIGARYSWIDLNDKGLQAGILHDLTLGLNWYLNPNIKFQWNYSAGYRQAVNSLSEGWVHGLGIRMAYDF
jgi:phosphate-selective porin OprO/OprP